jgi:hypothetical protein
MPRVKLLPDGTWDLDALREDLRVSDDPTDDNHWAAAMVVFGEWSPAMADDWLTRPRSPHRDGPTSGDAAQS